MSEIFLPEVEKWNSIFYSGIMFLTGSKSCIEFHFIVYNFNSSARSCSLINEIFSELINNNFQN